MYQTHTARIQIKCETISPASFGQLLLFSFCLKSLFIIFIVNLSSSLETFTDLRLFTAFSEYLCLTSTVLIYAEN